MDHFGLIIQSIENQPKKNPFNYIRKTKAQKRNNNLSNLVRIDYIASMLINELSLSKKVLLVEAEKPKPRAIRWRKKKGLREIEMISMMFDCKS